MTRRFCDFCNSEVDETNPHAVFDDSLVFEGKRVVLRLEFRNVPQDTEIKRPDICVTCRDQMIALMFGLKAA